MTKNKQEAQALVSTIDCEFGIDICRYETSDLRHLRDKLIEFLDLRVETDELTAACDMLSDE